ncbi:hypothetical protein [Azospirillum largimobile]
MKMHPRSLKTRLYSRFERSHVLKFPKRQALLVNPAETLRMQRQRVFRIVEKGCAGGGRDVRWT